MRAAKHVNKQQACRGIRFIRPAGVSYWSAPCFSFRVTSIVRSLPALPDDHFFGRADSRRADAARPVNFPRDKLPYVP
jgi:hypothetical protein